MHALAQHQKAKGLPTSVIAVALVLLFTLMFSAGFAVASSGVFDPLTRTALSPCIPKEN